MPWAKAWKDKIEDHIKEVSSLMVALRSIDSIKPPDAGMEETLFRATLLGDLFGRLDAAPRRAPLSKGRWAGDVSLGAAEFDPLGLPFQEAIDFFRKKEVIPSSKFNRLSDAHKQRAFSLKGQQDKYVLESAKEGIQRALEEGLTTREFRDTMDDLFDSMGLRPMNPWHLDTVYRTNTNMAYQAGRYQQMIDMVEARPYWQYITMADDVVRPEHLQWHLMVRRADDPFWNTWYPPNGYNCRCSVVSLSPEELDSEGLDVSAAPVADLPDKGFRSNPAETLGITL